MNRFRKRALLETLVVRKQMMDNKERSSDCEFDTVQVYHGEYKAIVDLAIKQLRSELKNKPEEV